MNGPISVITTIARLPFTSIPRAATNHTRILQRCILVVHGAGTQNH